MCVVLVSLYEEPEKPSDALEYIKKYLGGIVGVDVDALRHENEDLKARNAQLASQCEELNKKVFCFSFLFL